MGLSLLILIELLLIGSLPSWEYSRKWSRWPSLCLGGVLSIMAMLVQLDYIPMVL